MLYGHQGPVPHSGPQAWQSLVCRVHGVYSSCFGATVPHSGPQGCQSLARRSHCLQLAFGSNSVVWTLRSSAALWPSRLSELAVQRTHGVYGSRIGGTVLYGHRGPVQGPTHSDPQGSQSLVKSSRYLQLACRSRRVEC